MDKLLRVLFNFKELKPSHDDDISDRLTRVYTSSIMFLFCVIVTSSHYVGHVIECWCPAEFTASHKAYANTICWVSNTYYVPFSRHIPTDDNTPRQMISYYQWVPFILLMQGLLCYVPRMVWKFLNKLSGKGIMYFDIFHAHFDIVIRLTMLHKTWTSPTASLFPGLHQIIWLSICGLSSDLQQKGFLTVPI